MLLAYLALGVILTLLIVFLIRAFVQANPATIARALKWAGVILGGSGLLLLIRDGRLGLVMMLLASLMPLLMRWHAARQRARAAAGPAPGRSSQVETAWLRMELDHDTGEMQGTVLAGRHRGRPLADLSFAELLELLLELQADPQSQALLEAYLDRAQGPDWRERAADPASAEAGGGGAGAGTRGGAMTREEAYAILGLEPGASPEAIREAHRRLMLKNHPDQGGSTYIAAKLNQAKDLLLKGERPGRQAG